MYKVIVSNAFNGGSDEWFRRFNTREAAFAYAVQQAHEGYGDGIEVWHIHGYDEQFQPRALWDAEWLRQTVRRHE